MRMRVLGVLLGVLAAAPCFGQSLVVYDDALQNDWANYSYGGGSDFAHATTTYSSTAAAIALTPNNFNAIALANENAGRVFSPATVAGLRFYIHGGAAGGQQLRLHIYAGTGGVPAIDLDLDALIPGGIEANSWREVTLFFADAGIAYGGSFRRFDFAADGATAQPTLYVDQLSLLPAETRIFADGLEGGSGGVQAGTVRFVDTPANLAKSVAESAGSINFNVERVGGSDGPAAVDLQIAAGGTASAPADFSITTVTASWASGQSGIRTVTVAIVDDAVDEADETANLALGNATGAALGAPSTATLTIIDNDLPPAPGQLRFTASAVDVTETVGSALFNVERIGGSDGAVSVQYATANGTATAPGDYTGTNGTLNWSAGDATVKQISVPIIADLVIEPAESATVNLTNPTGGATLAAPSQASLTIRDSELMLVPQYNAGATDLKIFRRTADGSFGPLHSASFGPSRQVNSVAFAPDGKLWAVDNNARQLLRYSLSTVLTSATPTAEVTIGAGAVGDIFQIEFFGSDAYVSNSDFGATHRILKYPLSSLAANGSPAPTVLTNANLSIPAGLAFDEAGRLWVSNFGNDSLVRMSATSGVADRVFTDTAFGGGRDALQNPEGLAFDAVGTLWVGNNGAATISAYSAAQIAAFGNAAVRPVHQVDVAPAYPGGDTIGGLAFDAPGSLWANYQQDPLTVREYEVSSNDGGASYTSPLGQVLTGSTTRPGFGGLAFWPVPATLHRALPQQPFRGTTITGMEAPYACYTQADGPVEFTQYPRHDERLIDYFAGKGVTAIRFLVGWEALQSQLMGSIPAANAGNYKTYYDNYKRIVDYATNIHGMTVLVTPWQYEGTCNFDGGISGPTWRGQLVGSAGVSMAAWSDFWTKLAGKFADNPKVEFVLVTEPHNMSTMAWWQIAQAGVTAIRASGATQRIHVPGNGYSAASSWTSDFYDTAFPRRSNAYGWLNANGVGQPISDPANNLVAEVHTYLDGDESGSTTGISSTDAAPNQLAVAVDEARAQGYDIYLGEIGMFAGNALAPQAWRNFVDYFEANADVMIGFTWWAAGDPDWWNDVAANGGGHFSISPTSNVTYTDDTVNMDMIETDF